MTKNLSICKSTRVSLFALCLGFFMVMLDVTVVNVALPSISESISIGLSGLQWIIDGYTLTFACLLLSTGHLGDKVGAKTAFVLGLVLFALTSFACGMAVNLGQLTVFRLLQGVAAALVVPTSLALINASYEDKKDRARAIGVWGGVGGIAAASGPVVGAFLMPLFGWRAVFFVNLPIGIIGIYLAIKYVVNPTKSDRGGFDLAGQVIAIISIASLAFSLIEVGKVGWSSPRVIYSAILFLFTFIAFLLVEHQVVSPMFPLKFFRSRTFSTAITIGMILNVAFYGVLFILPLYFQQVRHYSVFLTGLAIVPLPGLAALASYLGGRIASITGPRLPMLIGLLIGAVGFLSLLIARENTPSYITLILPLALIGFGTAFTMPAATIAVINSVPEGRAGIGSGALNASRQVGSLIGVAVFGTIINMSASFVSGMHITLITDGILFLFGCCLVILLYVNRPNLVESQDAKKCYGE